MLCPVCATPYSRGAFLRALNPSDFSCSSCRADLEATYESRLRLIGGGIVLALMCGGLMRSAGVQDLVSIGASCAALLAWVYLRADSMLILRHATPLVASLK